MILDPPQQAASSSAASKPDPFFSMEEPSKPATTNDPWALTPVTSVTAPAPAADPWGTTADPFGTSTAAPVDPWATNGLSVLYIYFLVIYNIFFSNYRSLRFNRDYIKSPCLDKVLPQVTRRDGSGGGAHIPKILKCY